MRFDCIVVLAGGINDEGLLPLSVCARVRAAQKMYSRKVSSRILMSGQWSKNWDHTPPPYTEAALMARLARQLGVPRKALFLEEYSQNTLENAFYTSKLFLEPNNWKKVLVITSDFHVKRTQKLFARLLPSDYEVHVVGTHTEVSFWKQARWWSKEFVILHTQWFFQHFFNRAQ